MKFIVYTGQTAVKLSDAEAKMFVLAAEEMLAVFLHDVAIVLGIVSVASQ